VQKTNQASWKKYLTFMFDSEPKAIWLPNSFWSWKTL